MPRRITTPTLTITDEDVLLIEHVMGTQQHLVPSILPDDDGIQIDISGWDITWAIGKANNQPGVVPRAGDINDPNYSYEANFLPAAINRDSTSFTLVLPDTLGSELSKADQPKPGVPVYYYVSIRLADTGVDLDQQSYEVNGQIVLLFSELEQ